jgi:hypothetical protein
VSKYCVIGAGAAGLSALDVLTSRGHQVDCFEKSDRVGGHWNTDYDALHLITSRDMTHFEDFPMPSSYPHFPRRDQIRDYIHSYAVERGHGARWTREHRPLLSRTSHHQRPGLRHCPGAHGHRRGGRSGRRSAMATHRSNHTPDALAGDGAYKPAAEAQETMAKRP